MSRNVHRPLTTAVDLPSLVPAPTKSFLPKPSSTGRIFIVIVIVAVFAVLLFPFEIFSHALRTSDQYTNPLSFSRSRFIHLTDWSQDDNPLDLWEASWADHRLLAASPMGDFLPGALTKVTSLQNPTSCGNASFLLFDYRSSLGFGAVAKHIVVALHAALQTGRVLVLDEENVFYWTTGCPGSKNGRHECYFRPLSEKCSYKTVMRLVKDKTLPMLTIDGDSLPPDAPWPFVPHAREDTPDVVRFRQSKGPDLWFKSFLYGYELSDTVPGVIRDLLSDLPKQVHSKYLTPDTNARRVWLIALAYYFLRLNSDTARDVRSQMQFLLNTSRPVHDRFIGLPVRASDKCYGNSLGELGEMNCVTLAEAMLHAHMLALGETSVTKAIITSEDPAAITSEKIAEAQGNITFHEPFQVVLNTLDEVAGTGAPRKRISKASNAKLLKASLVTLHLQSQA